MHHHCQQGTDSYHTLCLMRESQTLAATSPAISIREPPGVNKRQYDTSYSKCRAITIRRLTARPGSSVSSSYQQFQCQLLLPSPSFTISHWRLPETERSFCVLGDPVERQTRSSILVQDAFSQDLGEELLACDRLRFGGNAPKQTWLLIT
jgi:hypothetical protein